MYFYSPNQLFCELSMFRRGDFAYFNYEKVSQVGHFHHSISTSRASGIATMKKL